MEFKQFDEKELVPDMENIIKQTNYLSNTIDDFRNFIQNSYDKGEICVSEIIKKHKPKAIFLENVKGLRNHDKGKTLTTILNVLREDLGYFVPEPQIVNAKDFGVPQNRERIYIVGFHPSTGINEFIYPKPIDKKVTFADVKEEQVPPTKYYLSTQYIQTLENHKARH